MQVTIDEDANKVFIRVHGEPVETEVTHTLEKHGLLLYWDGHGQLMGVEFDNMEPGQIGVRFTVPKNAASHA